MSRFVLALVAIVIASLASLPSSYCDGINERYQYHLDNGYMQAPGGWLIHKSCIHRVPSDTLVHMGVNGRPESIEIPGEQIVRQLPECQFKGLKLKPNHGSAWKAYAQYRNTTGFSYMYAEWDVPNDPESFTGQILYFWPGLEPDDNSYVLQPVLQYGKTPAGGANYWAVASWLVGDGPTVISHPLVKVNNNDTIMGTMKFANLTWIVSGTSKQSNASTTIRVSKVQDPQTYAYCVLETYNEVTCKVYPSAGVVTFDNIALNLESGNNPSVMPQWQSLVQQPINCNEQAVIDSPTQVEIHFDYTDSL